MPEAILTWRDIGWQCHNIKNVNVTLKYDRAENSAESDDWMNGYRLYLRIDPFKENVKRKII